MHSKFHFANKVLGLLLVFGVVMGTAPLVFADSVYSITESTGTVGVSGVFEIEYTVDTSQQTWANGDILNIVVPSNFTGQALSLTAEYDTDTNNDGSGEIAISAGPGNGQYFISGGNTINVRWSLVGWGAVANNASTIRVLLTATPSYANASSSFVFGGLTANGADINPSGSDTVNVSAADANASLSLSANSVVGVSGNTTLTLTLPYRLSLGDTVQFTLPSNLNALSAAFVSESFTGAGTFAACNAVVQTVTCTANGVVDLGTGNIVLSGIVSRYAKTGQTVTDLDIRDTSANASKALDSSVSVTDTTVGVLSSGSVLPSRLLLNTTSPTNVSFTSHAVIPSGGKIILVYPNGWDISQANGRSADETSMNGVWGITVAGQTATLTQIGGSSTPAGAVQFMIPFTTTPTAASGGTFTITSTTLAGESIETQTGIAEPVMDSTVAIPPTTIGVPSSLKAVDSDGGVLLTWEDPADNQSKKILIFRYNPDGGNTGYQIATVLLGTESYLDTNVKTGETVYYFLRAESKRAIGSQTDIISFIVGSTVGVSNDDGEGSQGDTSTEVGSNGNESEVGDEVTEEATEEETTEQAYSETEDTVSVEPVSLFEDVDDGLIASVNYLAEMDIIQGNPDGSYAPERDLNNAEAAALVIRITGTQNSVDENPYSDVPNDAWYKDYALTLHEEGLLDEASAFNTN